MNAVFHNPPEIVAIPLSDRDKVRKPGWYWVKTAMNHRKPHKRWVALEWFYEPYDEEMGDFPYSWLHGEQDGIWKSKVLDVIETPIPMPEEEPTKAAEDTKKAIFTLSIENDKLTDIDLLKFSHIMNGMTAVVGKSALLLQHTESKMVFEENAPGSWREFDESSYGNNLLEDEETE